MRSVKSHSTHLQPLAASILKLMEAQGSRGISALDAMRALGVTGGSLTKRLSDIRKAGVKMHRVLHTDPITKRQYGKWYLAPKATRKAA